MSKSKSKSTAAAARKVQRPAAKGRRIITDPALPLFRGVREFAVVRKAGKPLSAAQRRAWERGKAASLEKARQAAEAKRQRQAAMMSRRPAVLQRDYGLPKDIEWFLQSLFDPHGWKFWYLEHGSLVEIARDKGIEHALLCAYLQGCAQGYIEGWVSMKEEKRQQSRRANAAKRQKPRRINGEIVTLDERDAAIVAEYAALRTMLSATAAQFRLAEKHGISDKMVRIITGKARRAAR